MSSLDATEDRLGAGDPGSSRLGTWILIGAGLLFVLISLPIVLRGAPLADDFFNCLRPQRIGLGSFLAESVERLGVLRRAHFAEILITTEACQHLPFGFAIAVPLGLTLAVAALVRGLLRDLGTPEPWPSVGGAIWLLQPLGTEAALWPAATHIGLGLAFALIALRLHRAGRHGWGTLAVTAACLSAEQLILGLPIAVWATTAERQRRSAVIATVAITAVLLAAFVVWPGDDPRLRVGLGARLAEALGDPGFLVKFPAVGLGIHSIPLAVVWAFPMSILVLVLGTAVGVRLGGALREHHAGDWAARSALLTGVALIVVINLPVVLSVPHQGSPRIFTPTWLVISGVLARAGPAIPRNALVPSAAAAGLFAAGAVLSLALSVWVRWETADFTVSAAHQIAEETSDGDVVAVCGVTRTVVSPAPRGAFAVHELIDEGTARDSLAYYTGRRARFLLAGSLWPDRPCPPGEVDRVVAFGDLIGAWRTHG